jgi:L,D-transpeptidase catalytic domain
LNQESNVLAVSRRHFLSLSLAGAACSATVARAALGRADTIGGPVSAPVSPVLLRHALNALDRHRDSIMYRDFIGIADFSLPSRAPRFHLLNLADGSVRSHLVAHGRGSDPLHTGWLKRFSNEPGSNASSAGAYRTGAPYVGAHGHSIRLEGLEPTNDNAVSRAIVVHSAWYVSDEIIGHFGMLGRSEGCFAVSASTLPEVLAKLGPGRLLYADNISVVG